MSLINLTGYRYPFLPGLIEPMVESSLLWPGGPLLGKLKLHEYYLQKRHYPDSTGKLSQISFPAEVVNTFATKIWEYGVNRRQLQEF